MNEKKGKINCQRIVLINEYVQITNKCMSKINVNAAVRKTFGLLE